MSEPIDYFKLDTFTTQYLETLLWQAGEDEEGNRLEDSHDTDAYSQEMLREAVEDCRSFQEANKEDLLKVGDTQGGHDFCLTRNGHGAGFWDRGNGEIGDRLTDGCIGYGSVDLYEGDDGLLYT